jgi:uncharacterized protein YlzI (FlbEa/FlbD family)
MSRSMLVLIEVTTTDGQTVWINPPHIRSVRGTTKGSLVEFSEGEPLTVKERPEVVAGHIDQWLAAAYLSRR